MDVRVRLVFVDEVGCHVQRHRGFSSCWYLIPKEVKLVGDLTHVLLREFGLSTSCPKGLELYLDELRVLATQSIRIVRDNDTIVVQCPLSDKEQGDDGSETSTLKRKAEKLTLRKRKTRGKKEEKEPCKKKVKVVKDGLKVLKEKLKDEVKKSGKSKAVTLLRSKKNTVSSSSESASSSSSCSESSSSESEDKSPAQCNRKKVVQVTTIKKQLLDKRKDAATTCRKKLGCNEVASKTNAILEKSETKPRRRRRRRLRQRSGGRQRNSNQTSSADNSASAALSTGDKDTASQEQVVTTPQLLKQTSSTERQNSIDSAGAKGKRCGKTHVLFDEETGDQVEVKHDEHRYDARESVEPTQRSPAPELAKYGPSSSIKQCSRILRDNRGRLVDGGEEVNVDNNVPKREEKGKYVERWKRPYKIVATVLDKKSEMSASLTTDLTKLLSMYPTAPATLFDFVLKDVIAFKTLTLCLETWQPVLSEWQCGQVQSVDTSGNAILLSKWMLAANEDSIDFREARDAEQYSVQTSEISELRFLSGSSYTTLQQTEEQDAK
ncbi:unnamed protein product [Peronospora farinosa]|uniref:Coilin N-terminal domain-containing protein n=1 Tax=Peronospora farinosa TaxID=134698 RepID=A0AAV0T2F6_9STRA|nr:unnamed protein product [Peronospora farinosa]CAI5711809.1 unnamed protein product [Peronospora farinosa]